MRLESILTKIEGGKFVLGYLLSSLNVATATASLDHKVALYLAHALLNELFQELDESKQQCSHPGFHSSSCMQI